MDKRSTALRAAAGPRTGGGRVSGGFVIGPIVWALGVLAAIAAFLAYNTNWGTRGASMDQVAYTVAAQANLIRGKVLECYTMTMGRPGAAWPSTPGTGYVADVLCPGDASGSQNLWTGARAAMFPAPPSGFKAWSYVNSGSSIAACGPSGNLGGICVWTEPTAAASAGDPAIKGGLALAAKSFSATEADVNASTMRFTLWIKRN